MSAGGAQNQTWQSGLNAPYGLAFNSAGDLFEADSNSGNIYEFTPAGVQSTFASGLYYPFGLAFEPVVVPEPSTWTMLARGIAGLVIFRRRRYVYALELPSRGVLCGS